MKILLALALVLGVAAEFALCQSGSKMPINIRNIVGLPKGGFSKKALPNPSVRPQLNVDRLKALRERLNGGPLFSIKECNLKRVTPFHDPSIKRTESAGSRTAARGPGIPSSIVNMAINRAVRQGTAESAAAKAIQRSAPKIRASKARAKAADQARTLKRTKRQADDVLYMAETMTSDMCQAREKLIMSVKNAGDTCYTLAPQEVKYWECASNYAAGMTNPYPSMQDYFCEPDNYVYTSWYIVCPYTRSRELGMVRIQTAHVPINCACVRYKCDFEPYQSEVALDF